MKLEFAPYLGGFGDEAQDDRAYWVYADDGTKLRIAVWPGGKAGTIFVFPGRTEYVEKYGKVAGEFSQLGFAVTAIDWRGHGLSERCCKDRFLGHVDDFQEYQLDVDALSLVVKELNLPQPYFLLAHSMGGCIGLRSIHAGVDFSAAAFTAPMWGLATKSSLRSVGHMVAKLVTLAGFGRNYLPGSDARNYVMTASPTTNSLTSDLIMFETMRSQLESNRELALGGPSFGWLRAALDECNSLLQMPPPDLPALVLVGSDERVVDARVIETHCNRWRDSELIVVPSARHEILMETERNRIRCIYRIAAFFGYQGHEERISIAAE